MNILITGSRNASKGMICYARRCVQRALEKGYIVIVGDAPGIDQAVIETADELGVKLEVFGAYKKLRNKSSRPGCNRLYDGNYTQRDNAMIELVGTVINIWNCTSNGTKRNHQHALARGKASHLIQFPSNEMLMAEVQTLDVTRPDRYAAADVELYRCES
jgi:hypothetical protein